MHRSRVTRQSFGQAGPPGTPMIGTPPKRCIAQARLRMPTQHQVGPTSMVLRCCGPCAACCTRHLTWLWMNASWPRVCCRDPGGLMRRSHRSRSKAPIQPAAPGRSRRRISATRHPHHRVTALSNKARPRHQRQPSASSAAHTACTLSRHRSVTHQTPDRSRLPKRALRPRLTLPRPPWAWLTLTEPRRPREHQPPCPWRGRR